MELAAALVKDLRQDWTPSTSVISEKTLDLALRDHLREWIRLRLPGIPQTELKQWVAGHEEEESEKRRWSESKQHQVICLWGAGKTSDLFVYHPNALYGLPRRGISLEIKYVGLNHETGKAKSYAGAITTTAGQLVAYSILHDWTIGFVWVDGPRRRPTGKGEAEIERAVEFMEQLPRNASLIVRFRQGP